MIKLPWQITAEPVMFLLAAEYYLFSVVSPGMNYAKMLRVYVSHIPTSDLNDDKKIEEYINNRMVEWEQYYSYVNIPVTCFVGLFYGAFADRHGRKINILFGVTASAMDFFFRMAILSPSLDLPPYFMLVDGLVAGGLGDFFLAWNACRSYMADHFTDKKELSFRLSIGALMFTAGSSTGSLGGALLSDYVNLTLLLATVQLFHVISIVYTLIFLEQIPPKQTTNESDNEESTVKTVLRLLKETCMVYLKQRDGHKRAFLWAAFVASFLDWVAISEQFSIAELLGTYTLLAPLEWTAKELGLYMSLRPLSLIVGMVFGMAVLQKFLKWRPTSILLLAIASIGASYAVIGFAKTDFVMYMSLPVGIFYGLMAPMNVAFVTFLVEPDEVGKALALMTIGSKIAVFAQSLILSTFYRATLDWFPGATWLLMALISFVAFFIICWAHIQSKREKIGGYVSERNLDRTSEYGGEKL